MTSKPKITFSAFANPRDKAFDDYIVFFPELLKAMHLKQDFKTNLMSEMDTVWTYTDQVFLVDENGNEHHIQSLTDKALRPEHNIFKMWRAGVFCKEGQSTRFEENKNLL